MAVWVCVGACEVEVIGSACTGECCGVLGSGGYGVFGSGGCCMGSFTGAVSGDWAQAVG